jgi:TatD DNase family protein
MQFTDSHCHLDDAAFGYDSVNNDDSDKLSALLTQCQQLDIHRIIIPSIAPDNFDKVLQLCKKYHHKPIQLYPCLGIHPWFLANLTDKDLNLLAQKVEQAQTSIVAIGEIGIDGAISKRAECPEKNLAKQQHFFDFQLNLAKQKQLPVIIHHRQSHDKIIPLLKRYQLEKSGVIHGFSGSYQQAKSYIDLGYKLGVGSTITYARAKKTINCLKRLPLTSLVLETDAPSMPLSKEILEIKNEQQSVNSPINLVRIFAALTQIRAEPPSDIAAQLEKNIEQLFFS